MTRPPGHKPGHAPRALNAPDGSDGPPPGYTWGDYLEHLVEEHGSLAALALKVASLAPGPEDPASIERALRRLRRRGHLDGGAYGRRLLRAFGLPRSSRARPSGVATSTPRACTSGARARCRGRTRRRARWIDQRAYLLNHPPPGRWGLTSSGASSATPRASA